MSVDVSTAMRCLVRRTARCRSSDFVRLSLESTWVSPIWMEVEGIASKKREIINRNGSRAAIVFLLAQIKNLTEDSWGLIMQLVWMVGKRFHGAGCFFILETTVYASWQASRDHQVFPSSIMWFSQKSTNYCEIMKKRKVSFAMMGQKIIKTGEISENRWIENMCCGMTWTPNRNPYPTQTEIWVQTNTTQPTTPPGHVTINSPLQAIDSHDH